MAFIPALRFVCLGLLVSLALFATSVSWAQDPIATDRGPTGENVKVTAPGRLLMETGLGVRSGSDEISISFPEMLFRLGLSKDIEARLIVPSVVWTSLTSEGISLEASSRTTGTPVGLGLKWGFLDGSRGGAALVAEVAVPVDAEEITGEHVPVPRLSLNGDLNAVDWFWLRAHAFTTYEGERPRLGGSAALGARWKDGDLFFDVGAEHQWLRVVQLTTNRNGEGGLTDVGETSRWAFRMRLAGRWRVTPQLQLDAAVERIESGQAGSQFGGDGLRSVVFDAPPTVVLAEVGVGVSFLF
ncbi:MAG: hypothetical protein AAFU79_24600 [Myxococcota bacterium]